MHSRATIGLRPSTRRGLCLSGPRNCELEVRKGEMVIAGVRAGSVDQLGGNRVLGVRLSWIWALKVGANPL